MERTAIFPGSFNPFTVGHKSIVDRALPLFDKIVIAVGYNEHKAGAADVGERLDAIRTVYSGNQRIEVRSYSGLTVRFAEEIGARFILRGIRNSADFEYEKTIADVNREIGGVETVFIATLPELSAVSSSMVRELEHKGFDTSRYLP